MKDLLSRLGGKGRKRATDAVAADASPTVPAPVPAADPPRADGGLQAEIDALPAGAVLTVHPPLERQGPIVFAKPIVFRGQGVTVWGQGGPVVGIRSAGVALHDVQIETVGEPVPAEGIALDVAPGCTGTFQNVLVRGRVQGVPGEEGQWQHPHAVALGSIASGVGHAFRLRLVVPAACRIRSRIEPVHLAPEALAGGPNEIEVCVDRLPKDTLIHGDLVIESAHLSRAIRLTGYAVAAERTALAAPGIPPRVVWEPPSWEAVPSGGTPPVTAPPSPAASVPLPPPAPVAAPAAPVAGTSAPGPASSTVPAPPAASPTASQLPARARGLRQIANPISGVFVPAQPASAADGAAKASEPASGGRAAPDPTPTAPSPRRFTRQRASVPALFGGKSEPARGPHSDSGAAGDDAPRGDDED